MSMQESMPAPSFVLPAQPLNDVLVRRARPHRTENPEARANSLLPPEESTTVYSSVGEAGAATRPSLQRADSDYSQPSEVDIMDSPPRPNTLAYPGVAGPEADVGMRQSSA